MTISGIYDRLEAVLVATIPNGEAVAGDTGTILCSIDAARLNLTSRLERGDIDLPIWVLDAGDLANDESWGVDSDSCRCPVRILEIRKADGTNNIQKVIQGNLTLVRAALQSQDFDEFQVIERGEITTGPSDDEVEALLSLSQNLLGGTLSYYPGLLCGENL